MYSEESEKHETSLTHIHSRIPREEMEAKERCLGFPPENWANKNKEGQNSGESGGFKTKQI